MTIHKSQGLSLDNAIIDLSDRVFSPGMAYVSLSRVRTLSGVHLTVFEPSSIIADNCCIKEINQLRRVHRLDLPQYTIADECGSRQHKLTGRNVIDEPDSKKQENPCKNFKQDLASFQFKIMQESFIVSCKIFREFGTKIMCYLA